MKKLLFILSFPLWLGLLGCSKDSESDEPHDPYLDYAMGDEFPSRTRSQSEAIAIAISAADYNYPEKSRSSMGHKVKAVQPCITASTRGQGSDTLYYVVNFEDDNGFAVISGPRAAQAVLAVVENGNYDINKEIENPGFKLFMDYIPGYLESVQDIEIGGEIKPATKYKIVVDTLVHWGSRDNYKVHVAWDQNDMYGAYCPNGLCGCAPLAIGTIMVNLGLNALPQYDIKYSFAERDIQGERLDFTEIIRHRGHATYNYWDFKYEYECYAEDETETDNSLGRLLRQIGYDCNSDYSNPYVTSTKPEVYSKVLRKYMPYAQVSELKEYKSYEVMSLIDKGLLMMRAELKENSKKGHAWVADGYEYSVIKETVWRLIPQFDIWVETDDSREYVSSLTHFCWGWNGDKDGYFAGIVFDTEWYTFVKPQYISIIPM